MAVYRHGTLTHAAESLGISQPAVSQHVKALEEAYGRQLFLRLPRGVAPTPAAHALARDVVGPIDALEVAAQSLPSGGEGPDELRVGGPAHLLLPAVASALAVLSSRLDRLTFEVDDEATLRARLRAGDLDLVVGYAANGGDDLRSERLFDEELSLLAGRGWAGQIDADALRHEPDRAIGTVPWIASADAPDTSAGWRSHVLADAARAPVVTVPDVRGMVDAVAAGAGVAVVPRHVAAGALAAGAVVELLHVPSRPVRVTSARDGAPRWVRIGIDLLHRAAPSWNREPVVTLG